MAQEPRDSTLAVERSFFAAGYREGYEQCVIGNPSRFEAPTLLGLGP